MINSREWCYFTSITLAVSFSLFALSKLKDTALKTQTQERNEKKENRNLKESNWLAQTFG